MSIQTVDSLNIGRYTALAAAKSAVGPANPVFNRAHNRAKAVFLCEAQPHLRIMVGRAGEPQGSPGSLLTGFCSPVRLTTLEPANSGGELSLLPTEAAAMATTPTQTNRKSAREGETLLTHADHLNILLDTMHYLSTQSSVDARVQLVRMLLVARKQGQQLREALSRKGEVGQ